MATRETWRDRLIEKMVQVSLRYQEDQVQDVIEVVSLASGPAAEIYYKGLTEQGVRKLVKEVSQARADRMKKQEGSSAGFPQSRGEEVNKQTF